MNIPVTIKNLGPIASTEITVKPLTVFIGNNNTGKTWVAETISCISDQTALNTFIDILINNPQKITGNFKDIIKTSEELINGNAVTVQLDTFVLKNFETYFKSLSTLASEWMSTVIGTKSKNLSTLNIMITPEKDTETIKKQLWETTIDESFGIGNNAQQIRIFKKKNEFTCLISIVNTDNKRIQLPDIFIRETVYRFLLSFIHNNLGSAVHYLPAERTGIVTFLSNFIPAEKSNLKNEDTQNEITSNEQLSLPVSSLLQRLVFLQNENIAKLMLMNRNTSPASIYIDYGNLLEYKILSGKLNYVPNSTLKTQVLRYYPTGEKNVELELSASSSTVKDMVPLVLYLRYYLNKNDVLFLDEPEMNLFPEKQLMFMEFITMLVNSGIRVIMVTHSPYMVNHLNILMDAYDNSEPENIKDEFYLKDERAFIDRKTVSVYEFCEGTAKDLMTQDGLNLKSYDTVTDNLTEIYMKV